MREVFERTFLEKGFRENKKQTNDKIIIAQTKLSEISVDVTKKRYESYRCQSIG